MPTIAPTNPDRWLSTRTCALIGDLHIATIQRAIREGRLPATRLGGGREYRVRLGDLTDYLNGTAADQEATA